MTIRVFMVAGEASGDALGAEVLSALKSDGRRYDITGVGGALMQAQGLTSIISIKEFNVFGASQIIKAYLRLKARRDELIAHAMTTRPDIVVLVDNKGFSKWLGRGLKKAMAAAGWSAPIVQIVAPTVWAWAGWRAKALLKSVDHLLCLFPFECPYFTCHGLDTVAVGHPSFDVERPSQRVARKTLGIAEDAQVLVLLPGSRTREVAHLLPTMLAAARRLKEQNSALQIILPPAEPVADMIADMNANMNVGDDVMVLDLYQADMAMAAGNYGLICSGTVTVEAALSGLAGHVYYRTDILTTIIAILLMDRSKIVLANVVSGQEIYQTAINNRVTVDHMISVVQAALDEGNPRPIDVKTEMTKALAVGEGGFGHNAATELRRILNGS
jgi:lipid-A-disaccharide synthase